MLLFASASPTARPITVQATPNGAAKGADAKAGIIDNATEIPEVPHVITVVSPDFLASTLPTTKFEISAILSNLLSPEVI